MSAIPIFPKTFYKDNGRPIMKSIRQNDGGILDGCMATKASAFFLSSTAGDAGRRLHFVCPTAELGSKAKMGNRDDAFSTVHSGRYITLHSSMQEPVSQRAYNMDGPAKSHLKDGIQKDKSSRESDGPGASTNEKQLKSLDTYFSKLGKIPRKERIQMGRPSSQLENTTTKSVEANSELKTKKGIGSLDAYFDKLDMGTQSSKKSLSSSNEEATKNNQERPLSAGVNHYKRNEGRIGKSNYFPLESKNDENGLLPIAGEKFPDLQQDDESSDLYLISILASINIAVFLFEIASPIRDSDMGHLSLPLMYGAKINELILDGEWWRLVTPMFLHSGFLHVALGCWVLFTFGPQVCRGYGTFTFFLIYILGGISGNFSSFVHTPDATVGGTTLFMCQVGRYVRGSLFVRWLAPVMCQWSQNLVGPILNWTMHLSEVTSFILLSIHLYQCLAAFLVNDHIGLITRPLQIRRWACLVNKLDHLHMSSWQYQQSRIQNLGPVFAILGSWFIYQIQNKEMIPKEMMDSMFQKAVIVTVLSFVLGNFEHIDDWTHLGAACTGLVYGFFTCPTLQLDNASSKNGQEDGMTLIRQQASPCKSTFIFLVFILVLSSVIFLCGTQVEVLEIDSFE